MKRRYTTMKVFHFRDKVDSLPRQCDRIEPPVHIRIKPTNVCNHNCRYCAYRADGLQLGQDMGPRDSIAKDKMAEIIDDLAEMGVKAVTFSGGGEPFCYPHLLDAVKRLAKTPIKLAALTNGSMLTGEIAELFAERAVWLRVSIDGWDDASYARYRRVGQDEFRKVMANLERFKAAGGVCRLGISIIVDEENAPHVHGFIGRLKDIGVDTVKVSPCIVSNEGARNNQYHAGFFSQVKDQVGRAVNDFHDDSFEIFDAYHELDEKFAKDYDWCPYLQILPVIGADLNVYSCQDKAYNLDSGLVGSIKDRRFKNMWFSDKSRFFRINPSIDCDHHCVANAKNQLVLDYLDADLEHLEFV